MLLISGSASAVQLSEKNRRSIEIQDLTDCYRIEIPFEKAQPKQTVFSSEPVFIAARDSYTVDIEVTIYADNVPIPIKQVLEISCETTRKEGSLRDIAKLHSKYLEGKYSS